MADYFPLTSRTGAGSDTGAIGLGKSLYLGSGRNLGAGSSPVQHPQEDREQKPIATTDTINSLNKFIDIINYWIFMTRIEPYDKQKQTA